MRSIEEIAANPQKWEKLNPVRKEDFFNMTRKYGIRVKTREDIEEEKRERERILQEQYEMERLRKLEMERIERERNANKGLTISIGQGNNPSISIQTNQLRESRDNYNTNNTKKEELGLKEREELEVLPSVGAEKTTDKSKARGKRLTIVDTPAVDANDQKLDNILVNIYNKKRMSYIPVKKLNEDKYEFGSQIINIKVDGETIRGKFIFLVF